MSAQRRMCAMVGGALSDATTVSPRTMPRLFTCQRCILILVNNETSESEIGFFGLKIETADIGRFTQINRILVIICCSNLWLYG